MQRRQITGFQRQQSTGSIQSAPSQQLGVIGEDIRREHSGFEVPGTKHIWVTQGEEPVVCRQNGKTDVALMLEQWRDSISRCAVPNAGDVVVTTGGNETTIKTPVGGFGA